MNFVRRSDSRALALPGARSECPRAPFPQMLLGALADADTAVLVSLDADAETFEEWALSRARHHAPGSLARPGLAQGTLDALAAAQALTAVCRSCGALVHVQAARRWTRTLGRTAYAPGYGCGSRICSFNFRPGQFRQGQLAMADALTAGARLLVVWPECIDARTIWLQPGSVACAAADAARAAVPILAARPANVCVRAMELDAAATPSGCDAPTCLLPNIMRLLVPALTAAHDASPVRAFSRRTRRRLSPNAADTAAAVAHRAAAEARAAVSIKNNKTV